MTDIVEQLAAQLAEAEKERDRTAVDADADMEERLRELDGREALGELSADDAARARGDLQAERDARVDAAGRARRACDYVRDRLEEAAESAAKALLAEPTKDWQAASDARQKAAAVLAERERDVVEAEAKLAQADTAAEDLLATYIESAASARAESENHRKSLVEWAVRNGSRLAVQQLPDAYQDEALAAIEAKTAEAKALYAERDAEREFPRLESA